MPASNSYRKGIYLAIVTAIVSGISIFINKFAVDAVKSPLLFTSLKNIGVGIFILAVLVATQKWKKIKNLTKRETFYLLLIGVIGGSIPFYLYFTGLSQISAVNAALIHKTLFIWVAILAVMFTNERLSKMQFLAVVLLFISNLLLGGFKGFQFSMGELFVLAATILWAIENILAKKILPTVDPDLVTFARMGFGAILLFGATLITSPQILSSGLHLTQTQTFWILLTIIFLSLYVMSWYRALKYAPATTVTGVLVSSTLITNVLSAIFVTHSLNILLLAQGGLIILGTVLVCVFPKTVKNRELLSSISLD